VDGTEIEVEVGIEDEKVIDSEKFEKIVGDLTNNDYARSLTGKRVLKPSESSKLKMRNKIIDEFLSRLNKQSTTLKD
jgi:hypothetical protein